MNTRKKLILTIILLSYFITAIDASIVITGVTKIASDLQLSPPLSSFMGAERLCVGLGWLHAVRRTFE